MCGKCYSWAFDFMVHFMWNHREADPGRYKLCVGLLREPESGLRHDHAWIEDTAAEEILYKFATGRKIKHSSGKEFHRLMRPRYVKNISAREMIKRVLKAGMPGLLPKFPRKVLEASDVRLHWKAY